MNLKNSTRANPKQPQQRVKESQAFCSIAVDFWGPSVGIIEQPAAIADGKSNLLWN